MGRENGPNKTIGAIEKSVAILEALQDLGGAGVTEVAEHVETTKGTVHNHLATLENEDLVVKQGDTYDVSLRFLDFSHYAKNRFPITTLAKDQVDRLAEESGEMALFTVEEHGKGVCLYVAYGDRAVQTPLHVGHRSHLHNTAVGKAILAFKSREEVEEFIADHGLSQVTEKTITDEAAFIEELEEVREQGIAYNYEETIHGLVGVGAPVRRHDGTIAGALSIIGPVSRLDDERLEDELPDMITRSANIIEVNSTSI